MALSEGPDSGFRIRSAGGTPAETSKVEADPHPRDSRACPRRAAVSRKYCVHVRV